MPRKNSHCSYCGAAFDDSQPWPRKCAHCGETTFLNPIPVVVVIVPVDDGVLLIRRNVEPRIGLMALPGGYVDFGETWQEAGAREVYEETGIRIDAAKLRAFQVHSGDYNTLLVFAIAEPLTASDLPAFANNSETTERVVVREPQALAFPLHGQVMREYFAQIAHNHRELTSIPFGE